LFGIGYAIASLSCTLPIFLLVIFQGLSAGGVTWGSIVFLTYSLVMGLVMIAVSIAIGISNQKFVKWLKRIGSKMNTITSMVLILAGS
jgi:cytochrome c biogenesis protein CcdA